ncbi:SDR family oxidoreductase [soil metagenome]
MGINAKPRLLLTGATGFLGFNVYHQAKELYQILGLAHSHTVALPGMQLIKLDLTQETGLRNIIREARPDAIMHLAAISDVNYCQLHPAETDNVNVDAAINIAKLAAELDVPMVFTSSDMVFDGEKGNYSETDAVNPINHYGEQKVRAEEGISRVYPEAAICRMPLMYGWPGPTSNNFFTAHLQKLQNAEAISLFTDEYRTPLGAISAAKGLIHALSSFHGIYHLGGAERVSRYEFGLMMAKAARVQPNIIAALQKDVSMSAPRPKDVSLNSEKAVTQGFAPNSIVLELAEIIKK